MVMEKQIDQDKIPGDTNGDGKVDDQDKIPGDTNGDGKVDDQDKIPGDTNGDGKVDDQDKIPGDTNGDGKVDDQDKIPGDTNGDGKVDDQDKIPGDTNGDGKVDDQDKIPGDTNGDGKVDDQDIGTANLETGYSANLAPPGVEECQEGKYQSHCYKTCKSSDVVNCNENHNCAPDSYVDKIGDCVPCDAVCLQERAKLASNEEEGKCDEGEWKDEDNKGRCEPCDDDSEEEEECKDEEKKKEKDKEEGSIPLELIKILLNFNQEINEGFNCNKIKVKDRNIVLCRDAGITKQVIVPQNTKTCPTQTENIPLTGTLEPQGLRLIADLDPCMILDGSITLNIPNTEDIKVAVMYLDKTGNNHKGALINPAQIQALTNNQGLFKLDLDQIMQGKDPKTGQITTLTQN